MGFRAGCYATAFTDFQTKKVLNIFDKYAFVYMTISRRLPDKTYKQEFDGRVTFLGEAFEKIKRLDLREKDRLKLLATDTQNGYNKEKQKRYETYICFDFETVENRQPTAPQTEVVGGGRTMQSIGDIDCELPF